ncbi:hypothetical protein K443DRAFT_412342 [Laccaria amethystina LaAM-08-1]|uniref:Uncharacterized protein n=1 Tax=Laccaria amethystina LaAM-08-1 TaxID=1095629 RepID=A0A0C9XSE8_9AGAR|nr:hypothetical protein K443DRAFT_412342 [Laccaria amethystina LaAM-08-1]
MFLRQPRVYRILLADARSDQLSMLNSRSRNSFIQFDSTILETLSVGVLNTTGIQVKHTLVPLSIVLMN